MCALSLASPHTSPFPGKAAELAALTARRRDGGSAGGGISEEEEAETAAVVVVLLASAAAAATGGGCAWRLAGTSWPVLGSMAWQQQPLS